jgi:predicted small lipoprotein YifL
MSAPAVRIWIAGFGALLVCSGCGFKGPLYLPERNATVITHPAPGQTPTPAAKSKNKTSQPSQPPPSLPPSSSQ